MDNAHTQQDIIAIPHEGMAESTELISVRDPIEMALTQIEKRDITFRRILELAVKATHHGQWVDLGGKPWPTGPAAESVARDFAVSIHIRPEDLIREEREDKNGRYYLYRCRGEFRWAGRNLIAFGFCSSRDQFFSIKHVYNDAGQKEKQVKPLEDIDEPNIAQSAITNCEVNGIMRILGLRNLSWEMLKQFGIDASRVAKVNYKSHTNSPAAEIPRQNGQRQDPTTFCTFGQDKGSRWEEMPDEKLEWYQARYQEGINDPNKQQYRDVNARCLDSINNILADRQS